jgi:hypothetical protein
MSNSVKKYFEMIEDGKITPTKNIIQLRKRLDNNNKNK